MSVSGSEAAQAASPELVELRVHGVGGARPEDLLDASVVDLVAGDADAGFYVAAKSETDDVTTEAYSWGSLTRRGLVKSLWVLLLPFALTNVAGWTLPPRDDDGPRSLLEALVRLFAIGMSVASALWIGIIFNLTIFAGCGLDRRCATEGWLGFLGGEYLANRPTRLVVLGVVVVPGLWMFFLLMLGALSRRRLRPVFRHDEVLEEAPLSKGPLRRLTGPEFWRRQRFEMRLVHIHVGTALAASAVVAAFAFWRIDQLTIEPVPIEVMTDDMPGRLPWWSSGVWGISEVLGFRYGWMIAAGLVLVVVGYLWAMWGCGFFRSRSLRYLQRPPREFARGFMLLALTYWFVVVAAGLRSSHQLVNAHLGDVDIDGFRWWRGTTDELFTYAHEITFVSEQISIVIALIGVVVPIVAIGIHAFGRCAGRYHESSGSGTVGTGGVLSLALVLLLAWVAGLGALVNDLVLEAQPEFSYVAGQPVTLDGSSYRHDRQMRLDDRPWLAQREPPTDERGSGFFVVLDPLELKDPVVGLGRHYDFMSSVFAVLVALVLIAYAMLRWRWFVHLIQWNGRRLLGRMPVPSHTLDEWRDRWGIDVPTYVVWSDPLALWQRSIDRGRDQVEHFVNRINTLLWVAVAGTLAATVFFGFSQFGPLSDTPSIIASFEYLTGWPASLGRWLLVAFLVAVGGLIADSVRGTSSVAGLSVAWDVLSYWPRWFMPFAPTPYSFRAIEDIDRRIEQHLARNRPTSEPGDDFAPSAGKPSESGTEPSDDPETELGPAKVVLSAHSQGAILAVSALLRRRAQGATQSVGLLTYGNPLKTLYGRFFPAYFGDPLVAAVKSAQTDYQERVLWRNLFRTTDWIGGAVGIAGVDEELDDPEWDSSLANTELRRAVPIPFGHADYPGARKFEEARSSLFRLLPP